MWRLLLLALLGATACVEGDTGTAVEASVGDLLRTVDCELGAVCYEHENGLSCMIYGGGLPGCEEKVSRAT